MLQRQGTNAGFKKKKWLNLNAKVITFVYVSNGLLQHSFQVNVNLLSFHKIISKLNLLNLFK